MAENRTTRAQLRALDKAERQARGQTPARGGGGALNDYPHDSDFLTPIERTHNRRSGDKTT